MICAACGSENPAEMRFCGSCGRGLGSRCAACGVESPAGFRFCGACGHPLGTEAPAPADARAPDAAALAEKIFATRGRIEGERRQVTVVFCDLAGSTQIAEHLGSEAYRQLLDQYLDDAMRCVHRYEGVVNHVAGDGFMAIFGAPIATTTTRDARAAPPSTCSPRSACRVAPQSSA